eukprot:TRINITY_DN67463_c10_g3_i1.p1 TRINITY_DN67463_c10_g3~~TRINITY_DN67463_c10_g3_i1.p1  ORF type:complete len:457 (+),score=68.23 TRINITY_DN67463_c10_g3_i1:61-1431(+)
MADADFWQDTHEMLCKLVEEHKETMKLTISPKTLQKPPFRFIYDLTTALGATFGIFTELFDENERVYMYFDEKEKKAAFLQKIISTVEKLAGTTLPVRARKITTGGEPEKTNEFLRLLAKTAMAASAADWKKAELAVKGGSGGAGGGEDPPPPQPDKPDKDKEKKPKKSRHKDGKDREKKDKGKQPDPAEEATTTTTTTTPTNAVDSPEVNVTPPTTADPAGEGTSPKKEKKEKKKKHKHDKDHEKDGHKHHKKSRKDKERGDKLDKSKSAESTTLGSSLSDVNSASTSSATPLTTKKEEPQALSDGGEDAGGPPIRSKPAKEKPAPVPARPHKEKPKNPAWEALTKELQGFNDSVDKFLSAHDYSPVPDAMEIEQLREDANRREKEVKGYVSASPSGSKTEYTSLGDLENAVQAQIKRIQECSTFISTHDDLLTKIKQFVPAGEAGEEEEPAAGD